VPAAPPIQGVFAALPTPFDDQRTIDAKALDYLVDYLAARQLAGFALLTEAAEDPLLGAEERKTIVKSVAARLKGKKGLVVAISAPSTAEASDLARLAEAKGALAILLAAPRIPGIGYRELYRYVDRVVKAVQIPAVLVARPGNALESLLPEEVTALIGHPGLKGVFAPHAATAGIEAWAKRFKGRGAAILAGTGLSISRLIKAGATGALCGIAPLASAQVDALSQAIAEKELDKVDALEARLHPVVEMLGPAPLIETKDGVQKLATKIARRSVESPALTSTTPFALIKEGLRLQGHPIRADVRPPYEPVKPEASEKLKWVLQQAGVLV
jgi:4-hydroxy-tetrahydrodipicolinate synthase